MIMSASNTSRAVKHLQEKHHISAEVADGESHEMRLQTQAQAQVASGVLTVLQQQIVAAQRPHQSAVDTVLRLLIQWIILAHIPLSCVEQESFQLLLQAVSPQLSQFIYTSGQSIRRLVLQEFQRHQIAIIDHLQAARSKIHLSFDLWSSPNSLSLCGIVAHYVATDLRCRSLLLGLKRVNGAHSGENIAETILKVIADFKITNRVGYFQADNAGNNDTCVESVLAQISPYSSATHRRVRCCGHIINLVARAFLFGQDPDAFELRIENLEKLKLEIRHEKELLDLWRKRGSTGKLHNLILWIRRTPQRRQEFLEVTRDKDDTVKGK